MRTEMKTIEQHSQWLPLVCLLLLVLVVVPGIGVTAKGARRWLNLGVLTFQPVEAVKLMLIVWLSSFLARFRDEVSATWRAMIKALGRRRAAGRHPPGGAQGLRLVRADPRDHRRHARPRWREPAAHAVPGVVRAAAAGRHDPDGAVPRAAPGLLSRPVGRSVRAAATSSPTH
jgi:hypothetical protein